jgi:hypothetical protein
VVSPSADSSCSHQAPGILAFLDQREPKEVAMTRTERTERTRHGSHPAMTLAAIAFAAAACQSTAPVIRPTAGATVAPQPTAPATFAASLPPSAAPPATIPQPRPPDGLQVAPDSARVDLAVPVFSNPTRITNELFPISRQASVLMLGHVDGKPFRTEVTLLPFTRVIDWQGLRVETLVSQYVAYLDGQIQEVAYDFYAQDDGGAVWYFGEDVFDFADGVIISTAGTWLAGKDGPAAMIMPARPRVGDVYRPENVPGFVFEEVTVTAVDQALEGPLGSIQGGLRISELHADGSFEEKIFAPGYGEFLTGGGGDLEALALGVPTDAVALPMPGDLATVSGSALRAFELAGAGAWTAAAAEVDAIRAASAALAPGVVPAPIRPLMTEAIGRLAAAVDGRKVPRGQAAAIELARLAFDVQLRYRSTAEIDMARSDLWAAQILVDVATGDVVGVNAAVLALDYIRERFVGGLEIASARRLNTQIGDLQSAVIDADMDAAAGAATELRRLLGELLPAS